jgi:hypothetical protein
MSFARWFYLLMLAFQIYLLGHALDQRREYQKQCFILDQSLVGLKAKLPGDLFVKSMQSMARDPNLSSLAGIFEHAAATGQPPTTDELFELLAPSGVRKSHIYFQGFVAGLVIFLYTVLTWLQILRGELADKREELARAA